MSLYCTKCTIFTSNNNNVNIKRETGAKTNLYLYCIEYGFKKFETIYKEELSDLSKIINYI